MPAKFLRTPFSVHHLLIIEQAFNVVSVRTLKTSSADGGDPATAARIRDAAIVRFGRDVFTTGLRAIAEDAAVSPGLVVHYFGSKQGLRRACDEHVRAVIVAEKRAATTDGSAAQLLARLAEVERFAPITLYVVRSLREGGDLAVELFEDMIDDAAHYLEAGVAAGVIRPSRDPAARARVMAYQAMGSMLMWLTLHPEHAEQDPDRGGLPGAVRPEEPVDVAGLHGQVEPVQRRHFPERLAQVVDLDGRGHCSALAEKHEEKERRTRSTDHPVGW
jgi:AcrR family transcriptional regulator